MIFGSFFCCSPTSSLSSGSLASSPSRRWPCLFRSSWFCSFLLVTLTCFVGHTYVFCFRIDLNECVAHLIARRKCHVCSRLLPVATVAVVVQVEEEIRRTVAALTGLVFGLHLKSRQVHAFLLSLRRRGGVVRSIPGVRRHEPRLVPHAVVVEPVDDRFDAHFQGGRELLDGGMERIGIAFVGLPQQFLLLVREGDPVLLVMNGRLIDVVPRGFLKYRVTALALPAYCKMLQKIKESIKHSIKGSL